MWPPLPKMWSPSPSRLNGVPPCTRTLGHLKFNPEIFLIWKSDFLILERWINPEYYSSLFCFQGDSLDYSMSHRQPNKRREGDSVHFLFAQLLLVQVSEVSGQLTGHCFFPALKKARLEAKWKGKAIACHLLALSWVSLPPTWELFPAPAS